uniref:Uncharacterized protein n=1 Tax=Strombidium rassoulzadegani TaxID=1082188 RepID=A0A7S3CU54_9SPIT|mmetsp:Transcript_9308/g.15693  ORF Transcript_9308/g.15693 Transcript_9308/m.15693 type:complete len:207 (+) Transcript_9308:43-663(+)|eukprot:CAMPEP_0168613960 /NCGR_PEP_ID=MMETSP0449_2-20121227/3723_1 /TAXON_ID=1082188 /ORGANISM="Strombidium rassoulzadegani, Strain ras09" /LENGTH=206 /DNA_ID=CAMNT_0008654615 /DNA_START=13 /DNA_END=633 /DNA_ORIENTATION=-
MSKVDADVEEEPLPPQPFGFYLKSEVTYKIVSTRWVIFTALNGVIYIYHLFWTISGVDKFTDNTRLNGCGDNVMPGETASEVFDSAIAIVTIFHMIEWIRQTIMLTSALVGANLIGPFYVLSLNVPFGFIAMLIGLLTRYSTDGAECAVDDMESPRQLVRANYLGLQVICIILYIPMCFAHILFFKIKGIDWLHEQYLAEDEEEEE